MLVNVSIFSSMFCSCQFPLATVVPSSVSVISL